MRQGLDLKLQIVVRNMESEELEDILVHHQMKNQMCGESKRNEEEQTLF